MLLLLPTTYWRNDHFLGLTTARSGASAPRHSPAPCWQKSLHTRIETRTSLHQRRKHYSLGRDIGGPLGTNTCAKFLEERAEQGQRMSEALAYASTAVERFSLVRNGLASILVHIGGSTQRMSKINLRCWEPLGFGCLAGPNTLCYLIGLSYPKYRKLIFPAYRRFD